MSRNERPGLRLPLAPFGHMLGYGHIDSHQGVMGTRSLTSGTAQLLHAKITLGRFQDWFVGLLINQRDSGAILDFDHQDIAVRTTIGTGAATDAGIIVDGHIASFAITTNRAGRATNHANRVQAMHAGVGHHPVIMFGALPYESRIIVVCRCTRPDTIITSRATIQVDHHRLFAIDESVFNQEFQQSLVHRRRAIQFATRLDRFIFLRKQRRKLIVFEVRKNQRFHHGGWNSQNVNVAYRPQIQGP